MGWGIADDWAAQNPLGIQAFMRRKKAEENAAWRKREGKKTGSPWDSWDSTVKEHLRQINMSPPETTRKKELQEFVDWLNEQTVLGNMTLKEYRRLKAKYRIPSPSKKTWRYTTSRGYKPYKE